MKNGKYKNTAKLLALGLTFAGAMYGAMTVGLAADGNINITFSGSGEENDPYLIGSKEDLTQFAQLINDRKDGLDHPFCYVKLTDDITLNDTSDYENWELQAPEDTWIPIGYSLNRFSGVFDGDGHTISGMYLNSEFEGYGNTYGLFGNASGEIRNLSLTDSFIHLQPGEASTSSMTSGLLVGYGTDLDVENCSIKGTLLEDAGSAGGIIGSANRVTVSSCTFEGKIVETDSEIYGTYLGSIAGYLSGDSDARGYILNCTSNAEIISERDTNHAASCGGIVGSLSEGGTVEGCAFTGRIESMQNAGGIAGQMITSTAAEPENPAIISSCTNEGEIIAQETAGGIAGMIHVASEHGCQVDSCTNLGILVSNNGTAAGIAGEIDTRHDGLVNIAACTNTADIEGNTPAGIVSLISQMRGNIKLDGCINQGEIHGALYAGGIVNEVANLGQDWHLTVTDCVNEGDILSDNNAGGIICFTNYLITGKSDTSMDISHCQNKGNLYSSSDNATIGGILAINGLQYTNVSISDCINEGNLEYTHQVVWTNDDLAVGNMILPCTNVSGGIVGYVGSGLRIVADRDTSDSRDSSYLKINSCKNNGQFIHQEPVFAEDIDEELLNLWKESGVENILDYNSYVEQDMIGILSDREGF